jgi:hypothetical protein
MRMIDFEASRFFSRPTWERVITAPARPTKKPAGSPRRLCRLHAALTEKALLPARPLVGALVILHAIVVVATGDFFLLGVLPVAADFFQCLLGFAVLLLFARIGGVLCHNFSSVKSQITLRPRARLFAMPHTAMTLLQLALTA